MIRKVGRPRADRAGRGAVQPVPARRRSCPAVPGGRPAGLHRRFPRLRLHRHAAGAAARRSARRRSSASRFFAGEAEDGRLDEVLRDAWNGKLEPLYNYMNDLPALAGEPPPILPRQACSGPRARSRASTSAAAARISARSAPSSTCRAARAGCARPTISNASCARIMREGIKRFFITDDNLARNRDWEPLFDRLIKMKVDEGHGHRLHHPGRHALPQDPELHREGGTKGGARRIFIGMENINPGQPDRRQEAAEQDHRIPRHAAEMARPRRA